jgi:hypothetical protein
MQETPEYVPKRRNAVVDEYIATHQPISKDEEMKVIEILRHKSPIAFCWVGIYANIDRIRALIILEILTRKGIVEHEHSRSPRYSLAASFSDRLTKISKNGAVQRKVRR